MATRSKTVPSSFVGEKGLRLYELDSARLTSKVIDPIAGNQGALGTCASCSNSKIFLQNVCTFLSDDLLNIDMSIFIRNVCHVYLHTERFIESPDEYLHDLTPDKCTPNGYRRILLYLYFFVLYTTHPDRTGKIDQIMDMVNKPTMPIPEMFIPFPHHVREIKNLLDPLHKNTSIEWQEISVLVSDFDKDELSSIIDSILNLGLYINLGLKNVNTDGSHVITITTYDAIHYILTNTQTEAQVNVMNKNLQELIILGGNRYKTTSLYLYLPIIKHQPKCEIDLVYNKNVRIFKLWITGYVQRMTHFNQSRKEFYQTQLAQPRRANIQPEPIGNDQLVVAQPNSYFNCLKGICPYFGKSKSSGGTIKNKHKMKCSARQIKLAKWKKVTIPTKTRRRTK